jgi:3-oxoacyl-[acyl-carrier protein] reductase
MLYDLKNKNVIITGATSGFGLKIAENFINSGASVSICGRNHEKLISAKDYLEDILKKAPTPEKDQSILFFQTDVSKEDEFKNLINTTIEHFGKVDALINNAGIYGPIGKLEDLSSDKWISTFETNLFSIFYGCKYILPHFKENNYGKIINVSGGREKPFPRFTSYAVSKTAIIKLTEVLAEENKDYNIFINSMSPGGLDTNMLDELLAYDPKIVGEDIYQEFVKMKNDGGKDPNIGASLCAYLVSDYGDNITGKYISAIHDNWKKFHTQIEGLKTDIYTMRRVW